MEAIVSDTVLSEFEQAYYKREAEKLPNAAHTHLVLTLLYTSLRHQKLTLVHAQEALSLSEPGEPACYANAIWAMNYVGAAKSLYDLLSQCNFELFPEVIIENMVVASRFYNDYQLTEKLLSHLSESEKLEPESRNLAIKQNNLTLAQEHFGTTAQELLDVSIIASEVVEKLDVAVPVDSKIYILPESHHLSVVFEVQCSADKAFDLNWELSLELVERGLDDCNIVARFDIASSKPILITGGSI